MRRKQPQQFAQMTKIDWVFFTITLACLALVVVKVIVEVAL